MAPKRADKARGAVVKEWTRLWRKGVFGATSAADGARKSHYRDHERLISDIEKILSNIECNEEDNNPCLSSKFISEVLRNFERHANVYDDSYADALSTALQ